MEHLIPITERKRALINIAQGNRFYCRRQRFWQKYLPSDSAKTIEVCAAYGFNQFIEMLPQGYHTMVGEEGINLSGGQKQIIGLARALVHGPQLLILDEATSALDVEAEKFVASIVRDPGKKIAVVLVSHRLHLIRRIGDRIYILEKGKLLETSRHDLVGVA